MRVEYGGLTPLIQVFDMPASMRFYCDILGFGLVATNADEPPYDWVLLRRNDDEIMLNTMYEADDRPPAPDPARTAAHRDTTFYFGCSDVDAVYEHLRKHGAADKPPSVAPYGMKQLYFSDPDGYLLCLQWPASEETAAEWRERYGTDV